MFQPILNNIGPSLIEQGYRSAANSELAGAQALASGISQAGQSVGKGIGDAVGEFYKRTQQMNMTSGKFKALSESGLFPQEYIDKVAAEKDPDKMRGQVEFMSDMAANTMAQRRQIAVAQAAANGPSFAPSVVDLGNGRQAMTTSRGSAQLIPTTTPPHAGKVIATDQGYMAVDPTTGRGSLVRAADGSAAMPVSKAKPDPVRAGELMRLDGEILGISSEIAKGNKQWGPDWLPGVTSYADELRAKQAERDALAAGGGRPAAVAPPAATPAAAPGVDRAAALQQADAAIKAGVNPAQVKARLQQMGIQ